MKQKVEVPMTKKLNAQHAKAMRMIGEGSRDPLAYSRVLQDFADGTCQYHGHSDLLDRILEKLGIQIERTDDAEKRLGASFSEAVAFILANDRRRIAECMLRDMKFLVLITGRAIAQPGKVWLKLFCYDGPPKPDGFCQPRWAPSFTAHDGSVFRWEVAIG